MGRATGGVRDDEEASRDRALLARPHRVLRAAADAAPRTPARFRRRGVGRRAHLPRAVDPARGEDGPDRRARSRRQGDRPAAAQSRRAAAGRLWASAHARGTGPRTGEAPRSRARAADDSTSLPARARLAWNEGRRDDAADLLRRASEAPNAAQPKWLLAELLVEQGDASGALAAAERALAIEPQSIAAHRARARARLALGNAVPATED